MFYDQNFLFDDFLFSGLDFMLYKPEEVGGKISLKITVGVFFLLAFKKHMELFQTTFYWPMY